MAFEINEIGIHMQVGAGCGNNGNGGASGATQQSYQQFEEEGARNDLVEECVRRVLRILKSEQER